MILNHMVSRFISVFALVFGAQALAGTPPNIILIFIDDVGYADIEPFGNNRAKRRI